MNILNVLRLYSWHLADRKKLLIIGFCFLGVIGPMVSILNVTINSIEHTFHGSLTVLVLCGLWGMKRYMIAPSANLWRTLPASNFEKWFAAFFWSALLGPVIVMLLHVIFQTLWGAIIDNAVFVNTSEKTVSVNTSFSLSANLSTSRPPFSVAEFAGDSGAFTHALLEYWFSHALVFFCTVYFRKEPMFKIFLISLCAIFGAMIVSLLLTASLDAYDSSEKITFFDNLVQFIANQWSVREINTRYLAVAVILLFWTLSWFRFKRTEIR